MMTVTEAVTIWVAICERSQRRSARGEYNARSKIRIDAADLETVGCRGSRESQTFPHKVRSNV